MILTTLVPTRTIIVKLILGPWLEIYIRNIETDFKPYYIVIILIEDLFRKQ